MINNILDGEDGLLARQKINALIDAWNTPGNGLKSVGTNIALGGTLITTVEWLGDGNDVFIGKNIAGGKIGAFEINSELTNLFKSDISNIFDSPVNSFPQMAASRAVYLNASKELSVSSVTDTELSYLSGAVSNIQNQINNLMIGIGGWKTAARALVNTNVNISSPGTTLDGLTAAVGERYVLNGQSIESQNGVYVFNGSSTPMTRAADCSTGDNSNTGVLGMVITIQEGTWDNKIFVLTNNAPITIGSTALSFSLSSGTLYTASNGVTLSSNNFAIDYSWFNGDASINNSGEISIGNNRVLNQMINSLAWSKIYGTPTTLSGYGITDAEPKASKLLSGGAITIGTYGGTGTDNDIRVAAASWYLASTNTTYSTVGNTDFLDITPAVAGQQRYIGLYGTTSNTISKVEGSDAVLATYPTQPANTVLIGYVLVTDAGIVTTPDLSGYLLKADKATPSEAQTGTDNAKYLTPYSINNVYLKKDPNVTTITSSATPTVNTDNYRFVNITNQAGAITSMSSGLTGTPGHGRELIYTIKGDGSAITWGPSFASYGAALPTNTVSGKQLTVKFLWYTAANVWGCVSYRVQP